MRDLCLKKGEEINFLNTVVGNELRLENVKQKTASFICVHWTADLTTKIDEISYKHLEKKATCVRSLLVFLTIHTLDGISYTNFYILLRVLDLQGALIKGRESDITELPPCFWDLKCVETLDLGCSYLFTMRLPSKQVEKLERLKHLYLPWQFEVMEDAAAAGMKLSLPASYRMETLVNFDPLR
ncbi:LOW QUALITY PROTEIN: hypothetical protein V2J09_002180 [Rumex salicifolius]